MQQLSYFIAGCIWLMLSGCYSKPAEEKLILVKDTVLDFPSASSVLHHEGKLYVTGDDATHVLVLDEQFRMLHAYYYHAEKAVRLSKAVKPDYEASAFVQKNQLLIIASASSRNRNKAFRIQLDSAITADHFSLEYFADKAKLKGLAELNFEALEIIGDKAFIGNRGNLKSKNALLITDTGFYKGSASFLHKIDLDLPKETGISGFSYDSISNRLYFTASTEFTHSATDDGSIGDSYLGWINNPLSAMDKTSVGADGWINLTKTHKRFAGMKIESVSTVNMKNAVLFYLVADNDDGRSHIFLLRMNKH